MGSLSFLGGEHEREVEIEDHRGANRVHCWFLSFRRQPVCRQLRRLYILHCRVHFTILRVPQEPSKNDGVLRVNPCPEVVPE